MGLFDKIFGGKEDEAQQSGGASQKQDASAQADADSTANVKQEPPPLGKDPPRPAAREPRPWTAEDEKPLGRAQANDAATQRAKPQARRQELEPAAASQGLPAAKSAGAGVESRAGVPRARDGQRAQSSRAATQDAPKQAATMLGMAGLAPSTASDTASRALRARSEISEGRPPPLAANPGKPLVRPPAPGERLPAPPPLASARAEPPKLDPAPEPEIFIEVGPKDEPPPRAERVADLQESMRPQLAHIEQFAMSLELGCAPAAWVEPCRGAADEVARSAAERDLDDVEKNASALSRSLQSLATSGRIDEQARGGTVQRYRTLAGSLGDGLHAAASVAAEREAELVRALLHQVQGLRTLDFDRLQASGLLSLAELRACQASDLARRAQLDPALAGAIAGLISEVVRGQGKAHAGEARALLEGKVRAALSALEGAQQRFVDAEQAEAADDKRAARRARDGQLWTLRALLAQLGELEAARALGQGSLSQRIETVRALVARWS